MFDFEDIHQEEKRAAWYRPLGEFMVLFSNLEFTANEWINFLTPSKAAAKHIKDLWSLSKRIAAIIDMIDEYDIEPFIKDEWKKLWNDAIELASVRNAIVHNPPIENATLTLESGRIKSGPRFDEIVNLRKPLGDPGSGISLDTINDRSDKLRLILIELNKASTWELIKEYSL